MTEKKQPSEKQTPAKEQTDRQPEKKKRQDDQKPPPRVYSYKCRIRYGSYLFREFFGTDDPDLCVSDPVVVKTSRDTELGVVISKPEPKEKRDRTSGTVLRRATDEDCQRMESLTTKAEGKHWKYVEEKAAELKLKMKLVNVERLFGEQKVVVHYTSEGRVDFRELVHLLARKFRARIEMRQIGPRDCTRICGGIGTCGLPLCCATWLNRIEAVTIRMAKEQGQPLNPSKNCGVCGKLQCCLRYELDDSRTENLRNKRRKGGK